MRSVRIDVTIGSGPTATAQLRTPNADFDLTTTADVPLANHADAWLPVATLVAMRTAAGVESSSAPSPSLVANVRQAQTQLHQWWPDLHIAGMPDAGEVPLARGRGVGAFFSGGVDSFHTAHEHADGITHLVFVTGFDISPSAVGHAQRSIDNARAAAEAMGKQLIVVSTDVRKLALPHALDWGHHFHGAALAHVAHLLSDHLHTVHIPSSYSSRDQIPWGSTEAVDPLWSSARMRLVHEGGPLNRHEKISSLVDYPVAMNHLRVCWEKPGAQLNCGECVKCVRTALSIELAGGRCATLPAHVGALDIARLALRAHLDPAALGRSRAAMSSSGIRNLPIEIALAGTELVSRMRQRSIAALAAYVNRRRIEAIQKGSR